MTIPTLRPKASVSHLPMHIFASLNSHNLELSTYIMINSPDHTSPRECYKSNIHVANIIDYA